jgi:catechol 2,3-dioxygenase-like lactoylglutathione lyase family enzyme
MAQNPFPRMHVSLYVSNLMETVNFYSSFFGVPASKVKPHYAKYVLDNPSLIISFVENPERVMSNFGHLGFQVETKAEMEQRLAVARKQGLVSKEEMGTACCYAVQDKFWATDPDGHQWEVYYFHEDADFNDPHYELSDTSACCMPATNEQNKVESVQLTGNNVQFEKAEIVQPKPVFQELVLAETVACKPGSGCC